MLDVATARGWAEAWCDAWNRHDLEAILSHYADPPQHCSPLIVERLGRQDGTIRSVSELREYFQRGLDAKPPLHFELLDVCAGVSGLAIIYRSHRGRTVVEVMQLDDNGKVTGSTVYYR